MAVTTSAPQIDDQAPTRLNLKTPFGILGRITEHIDLILAIGVVSIVAMLILPLRETILDFALIINLAGAVLILITALSTRQPLQFSVFPALLLITTLFRLSLEVSALKLIIGTGSAGQVIAAFGHTVIGDNYLVGLLTFLVLVVVQFVVITAGAGRVAEVAARFTLDALPGKQMAIDADVAAGLLTQEQAAAKRQEIGRAADFYGAMDGASKFIRGDAIAAVVIMLLSLIGGFASGLSKGEDIASVLQNYTLLTIGEGLIAQIPALLISLAAGLLVTRTTSDTAMGHEVARQIFGTPRPLLIAALLVCLLMKIGFPPPQTLLVAGVLAGAAALLHSNRRSEPLEETAHTVTGHVGVVPDPLTDTLLPLLTVHPLEITLGYRLLDLINPALGGDLAERIAQVRQHAALDLGLIVPTVHLRDDLALRSTDYAIKIKGTTISSGTLHPNAVLLRNRGGVTHLLEEGAPFLDPATGLPAQWVAKRLRDQAQRAGYQVVGPAEALADHLKETVRTHAADLLTRQDTQVLLDQIAHSHPTVVAELIPGRLSLGETQKTLQCLLSEGITIRDMPTILEAMADNAGRTKDPEALAERIRSSLARSLCLPLVDPGSSVLSALTLEPALEQRLLESLPPGGTMLSLEPSFSRRLMHRLTQETSHLSVSGNRQPVLLCMDILRLPLRRLTARALPKITLLAYSEVAPGIEVQSLGMIRDTDSV